MRGHLHGVIVGAAVVVGIVVLTTWPRTATVHEPLTELYFNDHGGLMAQIAQGVPLSFSFTIHNLTGTTTSYRYEAYAESPSGARQEISSDMVVVADDAVAQIPLVYRVPRAYLGGRVVVALPEEGLQLHVALTPRAH